MDYSAFAKGWDQKGEQNRQSRLDNLKLWSEYKKSNPYAKLNELQDYRDSLSGGSNYLGQVLPNGTVLEDLARRNQSNYDQSMLERTYGNMERRAKVMGTLQADIDNAIMQSGGKDLPNAAQSFIDQFSELANAPDVMKRIRGQFSEGRFNALKVKSIEESMPTVTRLISANPKMSADDLAAATNLPKGIAEGALTQAQEQLRQTNLDWYSRHNDRILNRALELSKTGSDTSSSLRSAIAEIDPSKKIEDNDPMLKNYEGIIKSRVTKYNNNQTRELNERASREMITLQQTVSKDATVIRNIRANNWDEARARIEYLKKMTVPSDLQDKISNTDITGILDHVGAEESFVREGELNASYDKYRATRTNSQAKDMAGDMSQIDAHFGKGKSRTPNAEVGPDRKINGNTAEAAKEIAKIYDLNTYSLDALTRAWRDNPNLTDRSQTTELIAAAAPVIQSLGLPSRSQQGSSIDTLSALREGLSFPRPITFDDFQIARDQSSKVREQSAYKYMNDIMQGLPMENQTVDELQKTISQLSQLKTRVGQEHQAWREQNNIYARTRTKWEKIERGMDGWDDAKMSQTTGDDKVRQQTFEEKVDGAINAYKRRIDELKKKPQPGTPTDADIFSSTGDESGLSRWLGKTTEISNARNLINAKIEPIKRQQSFLGGLATNQTPKELEAKEKFIEWAEGATIGWTNDIAHGIASRIYDNFGPEADGGSEAKYQEEVQAFLDNPTRYMKKHPSWSK